MSRQPDPRERSLLHGHEPEAGSAGDLPGRALLQQARAGVQRLPAWMFSGVDDRERLVLALVYEARLAGLDRIDDVVLSASGTGVFAVQGRAGDAEHRSVYVDRAEAVAQGLDEARERLREEEARRRREAERAAMAEPDGPTPPLHRLRSLLP